MSGRVLDFSMHTHYEAQRLLPWLANGTLESGEREGAAKPAAIIDDLPLFRAVAAAPAAAKPKDSVVEARLKDLHPDTLTPREALDLIYELKGLTG